MKNLLPQALLLTSLFAGIVDSRAAVITFTDTLPTSDVLVANTVSTGTVNRQFYNMNGSTTPINRWAGVGFRAPSAGFLDKMTFFIYNDTVGTSVPGSEMTFSIYSLATLTSAPASGATPLYSETGTVPVAAYANQNFITFDLSTPFALASSGTYGVALSFNDTSSGTTRFMNLWMFSTPGNGNRGSAYYTNSSGATWTVDSTSLGFVVQTIPEPSTLSLGLFAGLAFLGTKRVRRTN